jgi:NAD(P)-dependent dehydrogenase (short-subunit alcohol dehydrogenase family)
MDTGLRNKIVLITGGASGIGRATAFGFAREGSTVAILDRNAEQLEETAQSVRKTGACVVTAVADLSTFDGVEQGVEDILRSLNGELDILVNNVGFADVHPFDELTDAHWEKTFQVNFMSNIRVTRKLLPILRKRSGAAIINNASDLARQPEAAPADYGALKAALLSVTKSLARAEAPRIRVNAVAPGPIWSPFWSAPGGFADGLAAVHGMSPREAVDHEMKLRQLPLERMGEPDEVANVIVFLASELSSYVTSSIWGIDGGSLRGLI